MESPFLLGTLSRGSKLVGGTANPVFAGLVSTAQESFIHSHVKLLDEPGFFVESVCAWILKNSDIPAPEALWVLVHKAALPKRSPWPYGEMKSVICFATRTIIGGRTLLRTSHPETKQMLLRWESCPNAGVFDEVVANDDRQAGNVLTDGKGFWLIDHGRSFVNSYREPRELHENTGPLFTNMFLGMIASEKPASRMKFRIAINKACGDVIKSVNALPIDTFVTNPDLCAGISFFLKCRSEKLIEYCMSRLGLSELSL